jgi:hypothetical protein
MAALGSTDRDGIPNISRRLELSLELDPCPKFDDSMPVLLPKDLPKKLIAGIGGIEPEFDREPSFSD